MNEQLLKDLVATAQQDEYNWDVVLDKFPELSEYDPQLLKDYVATVEKEDYNYDIANSKFPEFKFEQDEKAEYVDLDQDMLDEVFEAREAFTSQDLALQRKKEEEARKAKYNIDEIPGKYYIDGKEVDREILKNKLFDNDFINDLQDEKIQLEIPEEDYKLKSLADKQKKSGSRLGDLFESLEAGAIAIENFKNAGLNYVEDIILETTGYKPGNTQLAYRVYRDMMSKANIEKRNKLRESQREYKDGFVNSLKNLNFADAANLGFRTTAESLPLMVLSSIPAIATRGKSVPTTQLLIKQALGSSGMMSGVLIPDEYEESRFSDDPKLKELTRGDKLTRAFLRGGAEGFFEGIMGPVGAKSFNVFKSGIRSQVRKTFNIAGKEAAQKISKELGDKTAKEIMKAFGINTALEGVTEALTSLGQDLTDDFYGVQDLTLEDYMNNAFEAFALGSFMGGTVQSLGATGKVFLRRNSVKQGAVSKIRKEQELGNISKKEGDLLIQKIEDFQNAVNQTDSDLSEEQQEEIASLIYEKNKLKEKTKGLDPNQNSVKLANNRIEEIDNKISEISASESDINIAEKTVDVAESLQEFELDRTIRFLETQGKKLGKKTYTVEDEFDANGNLIKSAGEKAQEIYDEYVKENPGTEQMDVSQGDGFKIGNIAVINKTLARQTGAISVGSHETFHLLVDDYFEGINKQDRKKLIKDFKNLLSKSQLDAINKRIQDNYMGIEGFDPETSIEWFTAFSDAINAGQITFDESIGNKILNFVQEVLRKLGIRKEFENARQAYNFMKDYSKSVSKGQLSKRALKLSETPSISKKLGFSKTTEKTINNFTKKDGKPMNQVEWFEFTGETNNQGELVNQIEIANAFEGAINAKIKGTNKEVQNYFGRDRDKVVEDFKDILDKRGFFDSKIEQFNPEVNDNFSGYMAGIINNAYKTLLDQNTKRIKTVPTSKKIGGEESRATVGEMLVSDEISPEDYADIKLAQEKLEKIEPQQSAIANKIGLTENELNLAKREITNFLRKADRPAMTDPKKFFKALVDYTTGKGVEPGGFAKVIYDKLSLPKDGKLSTKNKEAFIREIAEDLIALNKVDPAVMRRSKWTPFYELEIKRMNPTQTQKAIDEGRIPSTTNLKAGNDLFKVLDPTVDEVVEYLNNIRPDVLKRKMPKFLGEVIIKNEFNEIVDNPKQPVYDAKGNETGNTIDLSESITEEEVVRGAPQVREKIARPEGIKFSKSQENKIDDLDLNKKLRKGFEKNVGKILTNNPTVTLDEAIQIEAKKIGKNRGFAYENVIISRLKKLNIKGFKVSDQAGGNKIGIPDFSAKIFDNNFDVEVKLEKAQYGDIGLRHRNRKTNFNYKVENKPYTFKEKIKQLLINPANKALENYRKRAGELGADLKLYDKTGKLPMEIYLQLGQGLTADQISKLKPKYNYLKEKYPNGIKGEGLQKAITQKAEFDISPVKEIYENKIPPTSYIQLKGNGLFFMGKNPLNLPIPELTGNVDLSMRVMADNSIGKDGVPMTTVNLRILPSNLRNITKSNYTLDSTSSVSSLMNTEAVKILEAQVPAKNSNIKELSNSVVKFSKTETNNDIIGYAKTVDEALKVARDPNATIKKIRVFDFDDTLATTKSDVLFITPDGTEGKLNAEEFAKQGAQLLEEGYVFDFSEFNKVTKGEPGPLLDIAKKIQAARGTEDVFVLTARAPEAQVAIKEFLDSAGLNIPLENITGLGDSTGAAKAKWMVNKAAEGYNDFYFADDAYQNVKAVKDAMSVLDVKSKVQQAKVKFSKSVNEDFNKIIEQTTGIASEKVYSEAKAKVRGANKGNKKFFIPYSAEDFMGLIYPLLSKGKLGDSQMAWFKQNLLDPYARAQENISADRLQLMEDFKALKKALEVPKDLRKKTDSGFTKEQAVRVYLFNKAGFDIPGISKTDLNELLDLVNSDGVLKAFGDQVFNITKGDGYAKPGENWLVGTITTDLIDVLNTVKRAKYLEQSGYTANVELIFSKENLNKLEAAYGTKYREAMENILGRMKSGKNRIFSGNRLSNRVLDYINNSTGAIMFFNTRSAVLQTISAINFLNWSFNNPIKAGAAFANQKQYWKDFVELINSDYLVDRRNGLKLNINESEIADAAATSKNKARAAINYILQKGFLPTQYADSFAIASGGATFYRNRINDLIKNQGMSEADAKKQAMLEWRETAEISQQSSDPSKISAQQASDLGRVILAFANTPMQYTRIQKRALQDLVNRRGDPKTNVSKIIYYAVVQNLIFNALQSALFKLGFDEEEDEKKEKMYLRTANGMLDSQLRGLGLAGATVAVVKNFLTDLYERSGRSRPEYVDSVYELLRVSPPISSKISKIRGAAWEFDSKKRRQEVFEKGFSIDNPAYEAGAKVISATVNVPLDRVYSKVDNISGAMSEDAETWQTIAMLAGWPKWNIMPEDKKQEKSNFKNGNVEIITFKTSAKPTKKKVTKTKPKRKKVKLKFK